MALLNPMYAIIVPFLFLVTIPLAIFAGITTTLAFAVLFFRVILVYLDLALALVPSYITGRPAQSRYLTKTPSSLSNSPSPTLTPSRRRRRRLSTASAASIGTITPISEGGFGLIPSVGMDRDFEGVGGWRLGDDEIWTTINSRLELPDRQHRNHHRSLSGGQTTPGGDVGVLMMKGRNRSPESSKSVSLISPNSSRVRTPSRTPAAFTTMAGEALDYFPAISSPKGMRKSAMAV